MKNKWYKFSDYLATANARKEGDSTVCDVVNGLMIDIEGVVGDEITASQFRADLEAQGDIKELTLRINSGGGSVTEGWAVANILSEIKCKKIAIVSGWAASMASVIACSCDEVRLYANSWLVIHNPWSALQGDSRELRKTADVLDAMRESMISIYSKYTSKPREEIAALLDAETWIQGATSAADGWNFNVIENTDNTKENAQMQLNLSGLKNLKNLPAALMNLVTASPEQPAPVETIAEVLDESGKVVSSEPVAEPVAVVEPVAAASFLAEITELKAKLAAVEAAKNEQEANAAKALENVTAELLNAKAALSKLSPGLQAPEAEVSSWDDAMSRCGNNYVQARKTYPDVYNQMLLKSKSK